MTENDVPPDGPFRLKAQKPYEIARLAAVQQLRDNWERTRLQGLGVEFGEGGRMALPCLCWTFELDEESLVVRLAPEGREVSVTWQVLTLNYLCGPAFLPPGRMISFADFPEGRTYIKTFQGRVLQRLATTAARDEDDFIRAAERLGGVELGREPLHYMFRFFPCFEIQVLRHRADEEFPTSCNVLFPENAPLLFSIEDAIVAAEKLISSLKGKSPLD